MNTTILPLLRQTINPYIRTTLSKSNVYSSHPYIKRYLPPSLSHLPVTNYSSSTKRTGTRPPSLKRPSQIRTQSQNSVPIQNQLKPQSGELQGVSGRELVLSPPALVVTREYEWGNIILGFEQANKYTIRAAPAGNIVGYLAEDDSLGKSLTRNFLRTHRPFRATIFDKDGNELFHMRRPMYVVSTSIFVEAPDGEVLGEVHMNWHLWRRRYDLYVDKKQFAVIDSGFLALDFDMRDVDGMKLASVNRDFTGFAREIFTDAGQYVIRMDPAFGLGADGDLIRHSATVDITQEEYSESKIGMRERAVILATAISIDFDYFSRHSRHHMGPGMMMMPPIGGGGGEGAPETSAPGAEMPSGAAGPGAVAGADILSDSIPQGETATPDPYGQAPGNPFPNETFDEIPGGSPDTTASENEWGTFEEPDHGFQEPFPDDSGWSESNDPWTDGDVGGGDEGGGSSIFDILSDIFSNSD